MANVPYPSLYQINTRVRLTEIARQLGRPATLADVPDDELDQLARQGFDWVWLLGVWQTGTAAQRISRNNAEWRREFEATLPDLTDDDIPGSCFAITGYTVHADLHGDEALARFRERLQKHGLRLMLDFVPNHMALDHPWINTHPDYFVGGSELELAGAPHNYIWIDTAAGRRLFAHGRDPYFPGWPDTLQLNYGNPALQQAMRDELLRIAGQCDGVRCDMAMLILPDVFERTWGIRTQPFWPETITRVRERNPEFRFMAEVYWDLEWTLQQQGFDWTYDKRLYDRLREGQARPVRDHLRADLAFQNRSARFLENHDEPRAAATFAPEERRRAAAVITFLAPGLRFFHQGQFEGKQVRISPHLNRGPAEPVNETLRHFYDQLLSVLRHDDAREGTWQLLNCVPAWSGNWTWDCFIAFAWRGPREQLLLVVVNYADHQSQCFVTLPFDHLRGRSWQLRDLLGPDVHHRAGDQLAGQGLYLDMPAWGYHAFEVIPPPTA